MSTQTPVVFTARGKANVKALVAVIKAMDIKLATYRLEQGLFSAQLTIRAMTSTPQQRAALRSLSR